MESKNYIIKSNSFAHLFELNEKNTNEPLIRSQHNIKLKNKMKLFKPKIIKVVSKYPTKDEFNKLFTNKKLKVVFKHDNIHQIGLKKNKNEIIRRRIYKGKLLNSFSFNKFDEKNNFYNTNKKSNILPNININENKLKDFKKNVENDDNSLKLNIDSKDNKGNEKSLRITNDIISNKEVYIQRFNKLKINSLIINSFKNNIGIEDEEDTKPWINLKKEYISRNTLNNERKDSSISLNKKTKSEILNYLYEKYSSINISNTNSMNKTNYNDFSKIDLNQKDEDSSISFKRYNQFLINLKKINNKIDDNNKININVLFSKAGKKLKKNNLIYDIKKTTTFKG